jgi:hypothetical protein
MKNLYMFYRGLQRSQYTSVAILGLTETRNEIVFQSPVKREERFKSIIN